jgi:hypothetical protein
MEKDFVKAEIQNTKVLPRLTLGDCSTWQRVCSIVMDLEVRTVELNYTMAQISRSMRTLLANLPTTRKGKSCDDVCVLAYEYFTHNADIMLLK